MNCCSFVAENLELERDNNAFAQTKCCLYNLLSTYLYCYNVQQHGSSALLWPAKKWERGHRLQKLLDEGANIQAMSKCSQTPLILVAKNGHEVVVKLLLPKGVDPDSKNFRGWTPLLWAAHGTGVYMLRPQSM
jgi:ankyrin repeat protein